MIIREPLGTTNTLLFPWFPYIISMEKRNWELENERARERYKLNEDIRERKKARVRAYKEKNKEKIRIKNAEYRKKRKENDPLYRFTEGVRKRILNSFKENGYTKKAKTHEILGCSFEVFKNHIESQFEDWMTWNNRGSSTKYKTKWEIDHIIPIATAYTEEDIIRLNHHTNLRPLCSKEKSDKILRG